VLDGMNVATLGLAALRRRLRQTRAVLPFCTVVRAP
jgi:hypothetical protein